MADTPPLPPGFTLDDQTGGMPPLPPGFRLDTSPPVVGTNPWDVPNAVVSGFNKGFAEVTTAPYRVIDWAGEKLFGGDFLPDAGKMATWGPLLNPRTPESQAGRYAQSAAAAVGGSVIPMAGTLAMARLPAGPAATTTIGQIGQNIVQSARQNPGQFVGMDVASSASGGVAQQAAADAGLSPGWQAVAGIAGGMAPGVVSAYRAPSGNPIGSPTAQGIARQRAVAAEQDAQAFANQEIRPFGPAFNQGPVASIGKQVTETPFIGAPLRNNMDETFFDTAAAVRRLADNISPNATPEGAGTTLQRGLDRYRTQGLDEIEPGIVQGLGIAPTTQNVGRGQTGGAAQMQRINAAQPGIQTVTGGTVQNSRGQPVPLPVTRMQRPTMRTTVNDLTDAELTRVIRAPSDATSFGTRSEALYERAWRNVPPLLTSNGRTNANLLPTANAGGVVRGLIANEARTGVRSGLQGRYEDMFETLANPSANVTLDTLRQMRTQIGRDLANFGMNDVTLDRTQLKGLYRGLSSDIEVGLQDLAARAVAASQRGGNAGVTRDQARRAVQALRDFQVADRYFRQGIGRMDRFLKVVEAENPQAAAANLVRAATDGTRGNMRMFRAAMAPLRPEERAEFGAMIVRELGAPTGKSGGARGLVQEAGFSPSKFVTQYSNMSPQARAMLFTQEHQRALDELFRVSNRLANVEALANTSRSASNALNMTAAIGSVSSMAAGNVALPLTIGGSGYAASVLMSMPQYTRWMTQYLQLRAAVSDGTSRSVAPLARHVMGLEEQARYNPELWPVYSIIAADAGIDKRKN